MRNVSQAETIQHLKNIAVYGYTRVEGFMSLDTVRELKELVLKNLDGQPKSFYGRPDRDQNDKMVYNLQNKNKRFIDLLGEDFVKTILKPNLNDPYYRFLPDDKPNYILNYYNARCSGGALDLHIDSFVPAVGPYPWIMQAVFVLDAMTDSNGCTVVVPGSHLSGKYTDRELTDVKPVHAQPGDLVFWDSRLWHGTKPNTAKADRWALIATVSQWWVKQTMDMPRSLPENIYKELNDEQKQLLGFCSIPPKDEFERINTKTGYDTLKNSVVEYQRL